MRTGYTHAPDGTKLYYEVAGRRGRPTVLLVMGLGFGGEVWVHTRDRLVAEGYHVVALDNRGMGRSAVPTASFTTTTMAGDAIAVLDAVAVDAAHVVGLSLGGMIAQQVVLNHPQRVRRLVLQSTTGGMPRVDFMSATGLLRAAAVIRARVGNHTSDQRTRATLRLLTTRRYADAADFDEPRLRVYIDALQADISIDAWFAQVRAASLHSTWGRLGTIGAPTLVQHGARDRVVRAAAGRALAAKIPGARFELYESAGHLLALQRPDSLEGVVGFLADD